MELKGERKEKENDRVNNVKTHNICAGRGYNHLYWKLLNNGGEREGVRQSNGRG
jgi:hypothetical protein